eukprot:2554885-Pyramimonas_sp.AAC.1
MRSHRLPLDRGGKGTHSASIVVLTNRSCVHQECQLFGQRAQIGASGLALAEELALLVHAATI